ncbi:alcohol dehydrogenase catalytic domain-containing protein [Thermodesulfobacteriota bacterium]
MMKYHVLMEYNTPLETKEKEIPKPGPGEILLKSKGLGLCYTDVKVITGQIPAPIVELPAIPGHEIAGEVVEVGEGVTDISIGDMGIVYIYVTCHVCAQCTRGKENLCMNLERVGFEIDGGFSEYMTIPAYNFCPVNKTMPAYEMAIIPDAMGTTFHAITGLAQVKPGQDVLIVGAGGLGIHAVQIAKLCGARVIVADQKPDALALADQYGADHTFLPEDAQKGVQDLTDGQGVDAVIEIVGAPETLAWSLPSLKSGNKLIIVGYAPGNPFPLDTMAMHYNEYQIIGSRFMLKTELLQLVKLVEQDKIKPVVSKTFAFEQVNDAIDTLRERKNLGRIALDLEG